MYYLVKDNKYENKVVYTDKELKKLKFTVSSCGNYIEAGIDDRGRIVTSLAVASVIIANIVKETEDINVAYDYIVRNMSEKFEKEGWNLQSNDGRKNQIIFADELKEFELVIDKKEKSYHCHFTSNHDYMEIDIGTHKLLHQLFYDFGWLNYD